MKYQIEDAPPTAPSKSSMLFGSGRPAAFASATRASMARIHWYFAMQSSTCSTSNHVFICVQKNRMWDAIRAFASAVHCRPVPHMLIFYQAVVHLGMRTPTAALEDLSGLEYKRFHPAGGASMACFAYHSSTCASSIHEHLLSKCPPNHQTHVRCIPLCWFIGSADIPRHHQQTRR